MVRLFCEGISSEPQKVVCSKELLRRYFFDKCNIFSEYIGLIVRTIQFMVHMHINLILEFKRTDKKAKGQKEPAKES